MKCLGSQSHARTNGFTDQFFLYYWFLPLVSSPFLSDSNPNVLGRVLFMFTEKSYQQLPHHKWSALAQLQTKPSSRHVCAFPVPSKVGICSIPGLNCSKLEFLKMIADFGNLHSRIARALSSGAEGVVKVTGWLHFEVQSISLTDCVQATWKTWQLADLSSDRKISVNHNPARLSRPSTKTLPVQKHVHHWFTFASRRPRRQCLIYNAASDVSICIAGDAEAATETEWRLQSFRTRVPVAKTRCQWLGIFCCFCFCFFVYTIKSANCYCWMYHATGGNDVKFQERPTNRPPPSPPHTHTHSHTCQSNFKLDIICFTSTSNSTVCNRTYSPFLILGSGEGWRLPWRDTRTGINNCL